ncbi:MAG: beta-ketoacyl-[acyl-carrier-protein] synthase family protein [Thermoleophilia bacterium]
MRRVVVTGAGAICSLGTGVEGFWDALIAGRSGATVREVEGLGPVVVCPVADADVDDAAKRRFGQRESRRMDRVGRLAALAGAEALEQAGSHRLPPERVGASLGCAHGGTQTLLEAHEALLLRGADRVSPFAVALSLPNSACAAMTRALSLKGPSNASATACAAGTDAIGIALWHIRHGGADMMVAGGAEAAVTPVALAAYAKAGALSPSVDNPAEASRPFDSARNGFVMGEGAGVLVLEERDHALARGATILAEVAGYGASCDAGHLTDPDPKGAGAARAITAALADARVAASDVGYVNAHATSTPSGDVAEARALHAAKVDHAWVSATKASHGHTLGAAGGVEAVATVLALHRGLLPPTRNLTHPDGAVHLRHVTVPYSVQVDVAISNSFGFGGHNACLVFTRHGA